MLKKLLFVLLLCSSVASYGQVYNFNPDTQEPMNAANNFISGNSGKKVSVGAYAQVDYNQPLSDTMRMTGNLDVHRLVTLLGYSFSDKTYFVTEIEMEHVVELYVEQAFLSHQFNPKIGLRAGLMLIPMGIINEYHEPVVYNGVERPNVDNVIVPSTWREIGAGIAGKFDDLSLKYQLYLVNGFMGYNGDAGLFRASDGYRKGRQKGAESSISSPNISAKIDYYGMPGLKVGLAGYFGDSQTTAYNGLNTQDKAGMQSADSTVINIAMTGIDFRYQLKGFQARGQFIYSTNGNTLAYNEKTGAGMGSKMLGYYGEVGYDVLKLSNKESTQKLVLFARYENYDTQHKMAADVTRNEKYHRQDVTIGAGWFPAQGAVLKADYQIFSNAADGHVKNMLNLGLGVWF